VAGSLLFAAAASANTITVTSVADPGSGSACTLRDAITAANTNTATGACSAGAAGNDDISVTPTGTIQLASALPQLGAPANNLTITGAGSANLEVRGEDSADPYRIFDISPFANAIVLTGLKVSHGGSGGINVSNGGLTMNDVTVTANSVAATVTAGGTIVAGGGIKADNGSTLIINNSTISNNSATATATGAGTFPTAYAIAQGAAIDDEGGGLSIDRSTISGNSTTANGNQSATARAAILTQDTAGISRSTINGNTTTATVSEISGAGAATNWGGAIDYLAPGSFRNLSLDRVTLTGNTAAATAAQGGATTSYGGGLLTEVNAVTTIKGSTISGNTVTGDFRSGANVDLQANDSPSSGEITFQNTIIANPAGSTNCADDGAGVFQSLGYNLDSGATATCLGTATTGDQTNTNPALGPLTNNGGPTQTMAPALNSPAVDKGIAALASEDQRGFARTFDMNPSNAPGGDGSDIGAVEQQIVLTPPTTMAFGAKQWGTMTTDSAFLQNRTGNNLTPGSLALGGANPGDFPLNGDNCSNGTMINNQVCGVNVVFFPTSAGNGARSATLSFPTDVAPTQSLALTGSATEYVSIAPTPHDFGSTQTGTPTGATQFVVTNAGPGTSGTFATSLTGANASEFQVTGDTCAGQTLAGSATCAVSVRFAPVSTGAKSAALNVTGAPGGTSSTALTGTATTPSTTPPPAAAGPTGQRAAALKKCKKKKTAKARKKCKKKANKLPV
jgi:CSLREA domain-containing protein